MALTDGSIDMNDSLESASASRSLRRSAEELIKAIRRTGDGRREFFDLAAFPWVAHVESHWPQIRAELDRLLAAVDLLPGIEEIQAEQILLTRDRRWKMFPLFIRGQSLVRSERRCPSTLAALRAIPHLQAAIFSVLRPGKELEPHTGNYCGVLRYHLGLKIPRPETQCGIRVGGTTAHWQEGRSVIFDDTHMHSAWNRSGSDRVVLLVDFARPLPSPLCELNEKILAAIGASEFAENTGERWQLWESDHGRRLDEILTAAGS